MKALVVYGTRYGAAREIAQEISKVISEEGVETDLQDAKGLKKIDISSYDLIVVGSGIKIGKWTKNSLNFLKEHKEELATKNVALFVTCGAANKEETKQEGWDNYLIKVAEDNLINKPLDLGLFGSLYDPKASGLMFKLVNRFIRKDLEKQGIDTSKRYDYRNWMKSGIGQKI
ncbi:flavodoxin domain-containing protein [Methanobacterium alcaliphilum]|uniref:flavodoxin domain-containing protein n=1 Tax=Methanobacterium alcaliphilum TaxID=392018 RepID=UPI00200A952E|nr:flavodoxin domain-containing protein [Methanobacterium alcaliphilum]MCK9152253.1 flavodoxin domain-containing protein [Methanobacterium alcaliphilum]